MIASIALKIFIGLFCMVFILLFKSFYGFGMKFCFATRISFCLTYEFLYSAYRFLYWKLNGIPFVPVKFPFIYGNISSGTHLALQLVDIYKKYREERHPIIGFNMFSQPMLLIVDLKLARSILDRNFEYFQDRGMYINERDDSSSAVLGSVDYEKWKVHRKILQRAFTVGKIKDMFLMMKEIGKELVDGLSEIIKKENPIEIRGLFSEFTTDIIAKGAIGIQYDALQFRKITQKAMLPYLNFSLNLLTIAHPDIARNFGIRKHPEDICKYFVDIVHQTIELRQTVELQNEVERNDFMQLLIDSETFTPNEIAALVFDFLSAGYADSTSTLSYCIHELSLPENEETQSKARVHIQNVLKKNNGQLTYEAVQEMDYIDYIINGTTKHN